MTSPLAQAFGTAPAMLSPKLSPDGSRVVFGQWHPDGVMMARIIDIDAQKTNLVTTGRRDEVTVTNCDWANNERLICQLGSIQKMGKFTLRASRLFSVNADGSDGKLLLEARNRRAFAFNQSTIVDWLPDDNAHIMVQLREEGGKSGVGRVNIYTDEVIPDGRERERALSWISDGHGVPRLYSSLVDGDRVTRWRVRETAKSEWTTLREVSKEHNLNRFTPLGFGEDPNQLLYLDQHQGRTALFTMNLANGREQNLLYSHPKVDLTDAQGLGKYRRLVSVAYAEDRIKYHFFDKRVEAIHKALAANFPEKQIFIVDEDWNQRYYLVFITSDQDAGTFYRFDATERKLLAVADAYPELKQHKLAPMRYLTYKAADGTDIPGYLTLPQNSSPGPKAAIVLPHGGPSARDYWSFNFLAQYLAAKGYAVLQSNYRGSAGYGADWESDGGMRGWRQAVNDIADGARYLISEGIADPARICAVGWSYGGYAALMSSIEHPDLYRCTSSIAGVTDPKLLADYESAFMGGRAARAFIGTDKEVLKDGSPLNRAKEIKAPLLLTHGKVDLNVPFDQSERLYKALGKTETPTELIEYDHAAHQIMQERYRIDLLTRLGDFLDQHIGKKP